MLNNKFVRSPAGAGQVLGGGPESYEMESNIAFFRDDFVGSAIDTDEWITTVSGSAVTSIASAGISVSAGYLVLAAQTATAGTMRVTSKRTYAIPFRVSVGMGIDAIGSACEAIFSVRDTSGVSATTVSGNPTYVARFLNVGSAGGTEHSSALQVRAGGTSAGYVPQATTAVSMSAAAGAIAGSAGLSYIIDVDYAGITFATQSTSAISIASSTLTTLLPPPFVLAHYPTPMLKPNQKYCVEFALNLGSACVESANASATGAANSGGFVYVDFVEVRQYAPVASLQRPGPLLIYSLTPTAGGGAPTSTALSAMGGYLKWY